MADSKKSGISRSEYVKLRSQGYTRDQIMNSGSGSSGGSGQQGGGSPSKPLTRKDFVKLRSKGYTSDEIKKMYEPRTPWVTEETAGDSFNSWGNLADKYQDWAEKQSDNIADWDDTQASYWVRLLQENAQQARQRLEELTAAGKKKGDEEFDAYQGYYDYFSSVANGLSQNNNAFYTYRDENMYKQNGNYYSYDDALKMEESLKNDVAGMNLWNGIGWESDASTMGGHIVFNYDPAEKKKKQGELDDIQDWLEKQDTLKKDQDKDAAELAWVSQYLGNGQDTEKVYTAAERKLALINNQVEGLIHDAPTYFDYQKFNEDGSPVTDELGNIVYDDEAYNRDLEAWRKSRDAALSAQSDAQRHFDLAKKYRDVSVTNLANSGTADINAIIAQGKVIAEGLDQTYDENLSAFYAASDDSMNLYQIRAEARKKVDTSTWSAEKQNTYYYLLGSGRDADADRLAKLTNDAITAQKNYENIYKPLEDLQYGWLKDENGEYVLDKNGNRVRDDSASATAGRIVGGIAGGVARLGTLVTGIPEFLGSVLEFASTGDLDPNKVTFGRIADRMAGNTAGYLNEQYGTIDDDVYIVGGMGWGDAYQTALSIAQSAVSIATGEAIGTAAGLTGEALKSFTQAMTLTQFFGSAASSGIYNGLERGLDPGKAVLLGTLEGAAEVIGEVASVENLIKIGSSQQARSLLLDIFKQAGIEASEEAFTTIMNTMSDMIVNGDKSEINISIQSYLQEYMAKGMSYDAAYQAAEKQAIKDWLKGLAQDALGGAISGGFSAGVHTIRANTGTYKSSTQYLMDLAEQTAEGSKSREMLPDIQNEYARKSQRKNAKRQNISARHGNVFAAQVAQDLISQNTDTAVRAIENHLAELGEPGDLHQKAQVMADALISEMAGREAGGFGLTPSAQFASNATANMRQVMGELQQARENFTSADYALQNESWTDEVMKGRFLDTNVLHGNRYATADYQFGRSMEKNLTQMADLEQQISEARAELETLSPTDTERKAELRNVIQEAETKLNEARTRQNAVLQDKYDSYSETDKNASVQIDGQEYKVSGLTKDGDVKLTGADGATTTVSVDDDRLPSAFRSLALKTKALGWASSAAFEFYKPGTDINRYIARVQNIRAIAAEKINSDAFMDLPVVKALDNAPLAEFLYSHGQELHTAARELVQKKAAETKAKIQEAMKKTGKNNAAVKGNVDIRSGFDINGKHFEGVEGKKLSDTQNAVIELTHRLSDALGIEFRIFDGDAKYFGVYRQGGFIAVNINAGNYKDGKLIRSLAAETLSHELTHFIEQYAKEEYQALRDAVIEVMYKGDPKLFAERVQKQREMLPANYKVDEDVVKAYISQDMSEADARDQALNDAAMREVVADACTTMLQNSKMVTELARQNMKAAEKVADFINQTIEKIRKAINAAFSESSAETYRTERKLIEAELDRIQQLWDAGLKAAAENYNAVQTAGEDAGVQFQTARDDYNESVRIDNRIEEINDELAAIQLENDSVSKEKRRRLENELVKLEYDAEQLAKKERSLTRKTSINELLENLDDYRPNDLISLANQLTDSNWDGVEDMQSDELREELRQMLEERAEDLTELERQAPKYGLFVRPVDRTYSAPAKSSSNNIVQFPKAQYQFQMAGEIEETDRLIAVHNKSVSGLKRMLKRGGVPFPSIAIKKAGTSHEGFGDVTIVFPRSTIDPQIDRQNRLYSNDAWTPTEPREEFDVGDMSRFSKNLRNEIGKEIFDGLHGYASLESSDIERKLADNSGDLFESLKSIPLLKYAYLKSIDKAPKTMYTAASLDGFHKYKNEQILAIIDALSGAEIESLTYEDTDKLQRIADALNAQFRSQFDNGSKTFKSLFNKPLYDADDINVRMIQDAYAKYKENNYSIPFEVDYNAMERSLRGENDLQNDPGYKEWIENTFADLIVDRGIPNGVDLFTPSGNRRSFKARHVPSTLDNIVRQMQKEQERGVGMVGINLRGAATKSYSTVEEMRSDSSRLLGTHITDEAYDSIMKAFFERFHELGSQASKSKDWSQIDSAEEILLEAVRDSKSKAQMKSKLQKEAQWINYTEDLVDELWQLQNDVQNMPAPYFEAKPRRVVYPDEALAYILPDNADPDVITQLQDRNYNVMTYEAGNEEDRLAKVNSVEGSQFQMADNAADDTAFESEERTKAWNDLRAENEILRETAETLSKEIEKLTKRNDKLGRELKRTTTPEIRLNDAKKLAREIVAMTQREAVTTRDKQYNREMADELAGRIKAVADYIVQAGENIDYDKVTEMAYEIAHDIVSNAEAEIDDGGATKDMREQFRAALKGRAIFVPENVRADTLDWNAFKKQYKDVFTFRDNGLDIDIVYESLLQEVPGLLDPNINNPGDMLNEMAEKWDLLQPKYENPYEQYENEATSHYMNMIIQSALEGQLRQVAPTYADRMNDRIARLQEERDAKVVVAEQVGREKVKELRAAKNERIEEIRQEGIARKQEALAKEREAKWAKVAEAETKGRERVAALREQKNERIEKVRKEGLASKQAAVAKERAAKWAKEAAAKQEGRKRLSKLRADKNERIEATRQYYQNMAERAATRRANGSTRTRIKKLVADLNTRLTHPTEKRYVPAHLVKNTIDILEMIDLDTGRGNVKLAEKIALLQQQYAQLKNDKSFQGYAYDPVIEEAITKMAQTVGDTPLRNMSANQLETVLTTLKQIEHIIRTAVNQKIHNDNINLYESGRNAIKSTSGVSGRSANLLGNAEDWYTINTMRPEVVFERFGGFAKESEWVKLFNMLNNAQRYGMDLQMKFAQPFEALLKDKKNLAKLTSMKEGDLVDIGLKDETGETIRITRDFMLFVYMNLMNEDNMRHVMFGGITVPELKEYLAGKGDRGFGKGHRKAVGVSVRLAEINDLINNTEDATEKARLLEEKDSILKEGMEYIDRLRSSIESQLTDYDRKWVDAWWKFNEMASEVMNETTMDVYGIKKFIVENYFPIITDKNYVDVPMETIMKDMSLENAGFTKERIHASTPIKMMGLADVINMQANRTAQYAAMMPATRAFNRIWNTTLPGYSSSLRDTVNSKFGSQGVKFVENLLSDLQGGRHGDFTIFDQLRGRMAQATLSLNPRVALAQTASFPTAAAELGWKPVMKALAKGGKNNQLISAADRELIAKWSSTLWFRTKGATGDLADVKNMQQASHKVMDKLGWAMNWIEFMDGATVGRLWYAAQYYVDDNFKDLQKGSDAYYEKVAEAFNRCVERTQPNYTTLQRPELLRNPHAMVRALTMFMTQRLQNQSILYEAVMKYNKYKADLASGKNGVTQADVNEMRDRLVNAATSQIVAGFTIALFKALCDGLLHRWKKPYRDDDEELTFGSVSLNILDMWAESLVSNVVGGSELYTWVKSAITGEKYYGVEVSGVSAFTDILKDSNNLIQNFSLKTAKTLAEDLCTFLGIPAANAEKIGQALWYWGEDLITGKGFMEAGIERTSAQNARLLTEAYAEGDEKRIEKFSAEFEDEDERLDAVRQQIKDGYVAKKQTISKTEAVDLLVKAGMRRKDAEAKVQEWTCEIVTGIPFSKIKDEFMKGNITQFRVAELLQKYGGRTKENAEKTARSYACEKETGHPYNDLKEAYLEGEISRSELTSALKKFGAMNGTDAENKAVYYDYLKDMPESKISEQRAVTFMQSIKKTGVTAKQYEDMVLNVDADDSGGYSQKEVGGYIQKHNFTDAQINALWKAFGKTWKTDFYTWEVKVAADATGTGKGKNNGNVSQAELGYYLVDEIKAGRMTMAQAEKYWKSLLTTSKKDFQQWCKSKRIKFN